MENGGLRRGIKKNCHAELVSASLYKIFASVQDIVNAILYTIGNKKYEKKVSKSITILRNSFACFSNIFVHNKWLRSYFGFS